MLPLRVGNVPMEFVNEDLENDSHGMREEVFLPVDHGKRSHVNAIVIAAFIPILVNVYDMLCFS